MYLLDTNVISELRKLRNGKADPTFAQWFQSVPVELVYTSVISFFEIEIGILLLGRRDPKQAEVLRDWFEKIGTMLQGRVVPIDQAAAVHCAAISVPDPRPWRDAFIGATACTRGFILVTRNVRDFQGLEIEIVNPWASAA